MQFRIQNATPEDAELAVDFFNKLQYYHQEINPAMWTLKPNAAEIFRKYFLEELQKENFFARLAFNSENQIAGILLANVQQNLPIIEPDKFGYITDFYINEEFRGSGLADLLLEDITSIFRKLNISEIRLQVDAENQRGINFYNKHKFKTITHKMMLKI